MFAILESYLDDGSVAVGIATTEKKAKAMIEALLILNPSGHYDYSRDITPDTIAF
jgi:hypothetical protein